MDAIKSPKPNLIALKRQIFLVLFICYIPHIASEPWWIFLIFSTVIGFRLIADYFNYPRLPLWVVIILMLGCLSLLFGEGFSVEFFIRCFLIFTIFKCLEINTIRDLKLIILCNFYLIFSALIVVQEVWIIFYLFIAILANLSIMLKINAPEVTIWQMSTKSGKQLLLAIPISILVFFIFPRIVPNWNVPFISKARTGLDDTMNPGSISALFNDDSVAMLVTFKKNPILNGYWRGLIVSYYNGESWHSTGYNSTHFFYLPELKSQEDADYEVILEPTQKHWLLYEGYPSAGNPELLFSPNHLLSRLNEERITQRFRYSLKVNNAPYHPLTIKEYAEAVQLPKQSNPRLNTWAKEQFAKSHNEIPAFINFLRGYIGQQAFWYTQSPPPLISDGTQMDNFWFVTQKGYCEHYASAVTFILRAAGIPARVVLGYYGGQWNPISKTITLRQKDAHAWLEYWQADIGWQSLDPTSFVAANRIDKTIQNRRDYLTQENTLTVTGLTLGRKIRYFLESLQYFSRSWFLYYNPSAQQNLLSNVGLEKWNTGQLLQASVSSMIIFFILLGIGYRWWQTRTQDALLYEYHLLQKEFQRFNISLQPSMTLKQQYTAIVHKSPALTPILSSFFHRYEQLRLMQRGASNENKQETIALFKKLRYSLRRFNP